jgi:hypothetical protein
VKFPNAGAGPWDDEPDREEWRSHGLPCLVKRGPSGAWCGYVGVPPGHPWHGTSYNEALCGHEGCYEHHIEVNVHGGLTYAAPCDGDEGEGICHVPQEGEPADVWWLGFDCAHSGDLSPKHDGLTSKWATQFDYVYRDLAYVKGETARLAEQIAVAS